MKLTLLALRLLAVFSLGVCGAILGEYLFAASALCRFEGTCADVMHSAYGRPVGVPLPVVGLAGFGLLLALSLFPCRRSFALVGPLALAAGLAGLTLILIQFLVLGQVCRLCLLVDGASVGCAAVALVGRLRRSEPPALSWPHRAAWLAAAVLAAVLPPLYVWTGARPRSPRQ